MKALYDAALLPLRAAAAVYGRWPRRTAESALERDQRMGRRLPVVPPGAVWIHGASLGEARLAAALARELRRLRPGLAVALSAVTPTGRAALPAPPAVDAAFFLPLDFRDVQRLAFDALRPGALVLIETELWPNLLAEAASRGIPAVLVNARLAPERLARYRRFESLYRPAIAGLAAVGASTPDEARRFAELGARPERLTVTGNMKFDLPPPASDPTELRARLGVASGRTVLVAGSTGAGEDALVLDAFETARRERPDLLLVLAPRHPSRFDDAARESAGRGLTVHRLSSGREDAAGTADVLLVDTLGRLAELYALGTVSFVGGSLVPVGGHNVLEPLAAGSPVVFGPHTGHVADLATSVLASGSGERVDDAPSLARVVLRLSADAAECRRRVAAGRDLLAAHRGAVLRTAEHVLAAVPR